MRKPDSEGIAITSTRRGAALLVSPSGVLDTASYPMLRDYLVKVATDQPDAVLVDLDRLVITNDYGLVVFTSASAKISTWPAVPILLIARRDSQYRIVRRSGIERFVRCHRDVESALANCRRPPVRQTTALELPGDLTSSAAARRFLGGTLTAWGVERALVDSAYHIVTELVENAIYHTSGNLTVRLELRHDLLTLAVVDGSPYHPMRKESPDDDHRPLGLAVVAELSSAWGSIPTMTGGKVVWATLRIQSARYEPFPVSH